MWLQFIWTDFLHKISIDFALVGLFHFGYLSFKSSSIRSMHDNLLKLYMDKEKATIDNIYDDMVL